MVLREVSRLILVVDDEPEILSMVVSSLEDEGYRVVTATCGEEALQKLESISPDLILLDITMPGISGLDTIAELRKRPNYVSVIFVSALAGSEAVVRGLDAGADDYICKPYHPSELLARVRSQLRIKDLHDSLKNANDRLLELIDIDDLTGLFNMRSVYQKLDNEIARARRFNRAVAVVMMDMDNFKSVNDEHDHLFGSFVLSEVGKLISANIRQVDFAARYGGDEFLIALSETSPEGALLFAERLRSAIEGFTFTHLKDTIRLTASLGVSVYHSSNEIIDSKNLVRLADNVLYEAKHAGKNCVRSIDSLAWSMKKTS
jgi:diguanylate cyclase (GGDEF)-like protein